MAVRWVSQQPGYRRRSSSCCWSWIGLCLSTASAASAVHSRIAVIGGGASGIFSSIQAATASSPSTKVIVFEAGPKTLGKVKISGGGRCNVLHDTTKPLGDILASYPRGSKELRGLYHKHFTPQQAREWFTKRGVELKTETDGRMFPVSDTSQTIIDTLLDAAHNAGVVIQHQRKVMAIHRNPTGKFALSCKDSTESFDAIILATGSAAVGHEFASSLGHSIVAPVPSLFTLNTKNQVHEGSLLNGLSGVSVPLARVTLKAAGNAKSKKQQIISQEGPLLITHNGISGPATLRLSAFAAREFHDMNYRGDVFVHWAPELGSAEAIAEMLWQAKTTMPKKAVSTVCPLMLDETQSPAIPRRLWAALVIESGFEKETTWNDAPKKKINTLARMLSECALDVTGKSVFKEEFVTAGGVSLKEIDMKTMQSKICPGLFLCGEVMDVDGVTGGFNFMNCWSTGYTAGEGAAAYVAAIGS